MTIDLSIYFLPSRSGKEKDGLLFIYIQTHAVVPPPLWPPISLSRPPLFCAFRDLPAPPPLTVASHSLPPNPAPSHLQELRRDAREVVDAGAVPVHEHKRRGVAPHDHLQPLSLPPAKREGQRSNDNGTQEHAEIERRGKGRGTKRDGGRNYLSISHISSITSARQEHTLLRGVRHAQLLFSCCCCCCSVHWRACLRFHMLGEFLR